MGQAQIVLLAIVSTVLALTVVVFCCVRNCTRTNPPQPQTYEVLSAQLHHRPQQRAELVTDKKEDVKNPSNKSFTDYEELNKQFVEEHPVHNSVVISVFNLQNEGSVRRRRKLTGSSAIRRASAEPLANITMATPK